MNKIACLYPDRDAVLVAYLYDDIDAADRVAFDAHVTICEPCRTELARLRSVRGTLAQWAPPEPARTSFVNLESRIPKPTSRWHAIPVWAQVAAAMLVLGASASVANLDVRYDRNGLSVRTGWSTPAPAVLPPVAQRTAPDAAPWRAELTALQTELRSEIRQASQPVSVAAMPEAEFRRRVRVLLDESERRQQNELALRLIEFQRDIGAQRQADLTKINQNLGYIQRDTYGELVKQREGVNYLLKVSQTR